MTAIRRPTVKPRRPILFSVSELRPQQLVPYYLMASYLYYERDVSAISDKEFDALARRLGREWDAAAHRHRALLQRNALGSGYYLKGRLPLMVRGAALHWARARDAL